MCRTQCVLALLALFVGLAHSFSWDVAVIRDNQLEFYTNGALTHSEVIPPYNIATMTYDPVHNKMLILDKHTDNITFYSYDISNKKLQSLVRGPFKCSYVQSIAYDPVTEVLFCILGKDINSLSLKPESNNNNLLIETNKDWTYDIAVDSCGGFIYWISLHSIYKARINGSEIETVINDEIHLLHGLTIDQQTQKIFWIASRFTIDHYECSIQCADLNGMNIRTLYEAQPGSFFTKLRVSKDFIYWGGYPSRSFWRIPKNSTHDVVVNPIQIIDNLHTNIIATNYKIEDQTQGIQNCEALKSLRPINSDYDSRNVSTDASLLCVHGTKVSGKSVCECAQGYTGERCDVSVVQTD